MFGFRYIGRFRYILIGAAPWNGRIIEDAIRLADFRYTRFRYIHKENAPRQTGKWVTHQWNIALNTIATDTPIANPMANEYGRPLTGLLGSELW